MNLQNISEWTKNINPPIFDNQYTDSDRTNRLRYKGGSGYERIYVPVNVISGTSLIFSLDFCSPSGFSCSYGDTNDYIAIISGNPNSGALNGLSVKAKVPLKQEATETLSHYEVSAAVDTSGTWYIAIDFGYMIDGVETTFKIANIDYRFEYLWKMENGVPHPVNAPEMAEKPISKEYPKAFWRIDPFINDGAPCTLLMPGLTQRNLWIQKQQPLIHVYGTRATKEEDFNTNGYAILEPISCEVYQETNGEYSATFEAYCDEYKKFTYLKNQAHVKLPIMYHGTLRWQIFRAAIVNRIMNDDGAYRIKAYCPHNFYANSRFLIKDARPTQMYGGDALNYICTHDLYNDERYPFYYSSDIQIRNTAYYERMSITRALLGADQSFVNRWGGKLYRDNFYFSINKETENYKDAGVIAYGYNMTAIDFETDDTEVITNLIARDNFGNEVILSIPSADMTVAERIYSYVHFSYDEEDKAALRRDAQAYLENFKQSKVNIKVNFLNLADIDLYKDFISLDAYEVGDKVTIYHKDLDIYYSNLEIIQKRYDVVAQRTTEVVIGNFKDAINRSAFMSGTASSGQSATDKNIIAVSDATTIIVASQSIDGMQQFPVGTIERFSIAQLEGGTIS